VDVGEHHREQEVEVPQQVQEVSRSLPDRQHVVAIALWGLAVGAAAVRHFVAAHPEMVEIWFSPHCTNRNDTGIGNAQHTADISKHTVQAPTSHVSLR